MRADPRIYQIAALGGLLAYGMLRLDFSVPWPRAAVLVATALGAQYVLTSLAGLARFDPKSALVSALSLCLLLRTGSLALAASAALLTIASKFVIRVGGKHVFNPVNFGLVAILLLSDGVWVSPGQWGSPALAAFLTACLGLLVVNRAARSDVTFAFILAYAGLLFARAAWLGDPWRIPLHQLSSGALLIFAFFMISDPKTTPGSRAGRILFAVAVAVAAVGVQFVLYRPNPLLWALAACAPLGPLLDRLRPGPRYEWATAGRTPRLAMPKGAVLAPEAPAGRA